MNLALEAFQRCVAMEERSDAESRELFRAQFGKSYYNIGMIYDKLGQVQLASDSYKKSMETCENDPKKQLGKSATYKKAGTNYAVTLEKLSRRDDAVSTLMTLKDAFGNEVRVFNNLGIIQKRKGEKQAALESYQAALNVDVKSFFPNYNMGVLLSQDRSKMDEALSYFNRALEQAQKAQENLYEINVLINIALLHEAA